MKFELNQKKYFKKVIKSVAKDKNNGTLYTSKQDNKGNKGVVMDSVETKKLHKASIELIKEVIEVRIAEIKKDLDFANEQLENPNLIKDFRVAERIENRINNVQYDVQKAKVEIKELIMRIRELDML